MKLSMVVKLLADALSDMAIEMARQEREEEQIKRVCAATEKV